jgi:glycosyltransferase involved in cell wall biosynthesis
MENNNQNHIAIVCPSFHVGGIERTLSVLANYFVTQNVKVTFISLLKGEVYFELDPCVNVIMPDFERKGNSITLALYRLRLIPFLRNEIKASRAQYVLSMADTFNPMVILATLALGKKVYIGDVTKPDRKFSFSTKIGKKLLYPFSTGFIAQTKSAAKYYKSKFGNKLNIRVINGSIKPIKKYDIPRKNLILNVGRLSIEKGPDRLIEVFSLLKNKEGWTLGLTAGGPMKKALEVMVLDKKLQDTIVFLGNVENLDKLYAEASIFVLPSRMEGFPNALCEAMAAGLPCICFDSFPADEIITNGFDGVIIEEGDIQTMAGQIQYLMDNKVEREEMGKNALEIGNRLSVEKIGKEVLSFIISNI